MIIIRCEVIFNTGDVIVLQEIEVRARRMTVDKEFMYSSIPSINTEEAIRWNCTIFQSLVDHHNNFFQLDIREQIRLYDDNMRRILDRIQVEATETTLRPFYGEDRNNWQGKLIHFCYLHNYHAYYTYEL